MDENQNNNPNNPEINPNPTNAGSVNASANDGVDLNTKTIPETGGSQGEEEGSVGPIVGIIIVVVIIVLGGLYFLSKKTSLIDRYLDSNETIDNGMTPEEIANQEDTSTMELQSQGSSDEVADIEGDLNSTDLEGLDAELGDIESEF